MTLSVKSLGKKDPFSDSVTDVYTLLGDARLLYYVCTYCLTCSTY